MRKSIVLSAFLHLIVLAVVLFNVSSGSKKPPVEQPLAVEMVAPSDISQTKAGNSDTADKDAKDAAPSGPKAPPEEKKAESTAPVPPEPKPVEKAAKKLAAPPPPKPKTATAEPSPAKPEPRQPEKAKPAPAPEPDAHQQAKAAPVPPLAKRPQPRHEKSSDMLPAEPPEERRQRPLQHSDRAVKRDALPDHDRDRDEDTAEEEPPLRSESRSKFDPHKISALLNRDPNAGALPPPQDGPKAPWRRPSSLQDQSTGMNSADTPQRERYGTPEGQGDRMSANEIDAFRAQVSRCWTPPVGGLGGDAIIVKLHIELNENGTLARAPQVANRIDSPFFTPAADSAVRALLQCEPYRMPPEKFSQWRDMLLNFDPRQMYGG